MRKTLCRNIATLGFVIMGATALLPVAGYGFGFGDLGKLTNMATGASSSVAGEEVLTQVLKTLDTGREIEKRREQLYVKLDKLFNQSEEIAGKTDTTFECIKRAMLNTDKSSAFVCELIPLVYGDRKSNEDVSKDLSNNYSARLTSDSDRTNQRSENAKSVEKIFEAAIPELKKASKDELYKAIKNVTQGQKIVGLISDQAKVTSQTMEEATQEIKREGGAVAVDSLKMVGMLALEITSLNKLIDQAGSNPVAFAMSLGKIKQAIEDVNLMITSLNAYSADMKIAGDAATTIQEQTKQTIEHLATVKRSMENYDMAVMEIGKKMGEDKELADVKSKIEPEVTLDVIFPSEPG